VAAVVRIVAHGLDVNSSTPAHRWTMESDRQAAQLPANSAATCAYVEARSKACRTRRPIHTIGRCWSV